MRLRCPEYLWSLTGTLHRRGWTACARLVKTFNWFLHKCLLPGEAIFGRGLSLEHYALGVVIHPQVRIGVDCQIYHHVTLAAQTWIGSPHFIIVGDRVSIGAHSIVIARTNQTLTIGDGAVIGAGAVVTNDIPAGETWAGNPARRLHEAAVSGSDDPLLNQA